MFEARLFNLRDGAHMLTLPATAAPWASKFSGSSGSVTILASEFPVSQETMRSLFQPNNRIIGIVGPGDEVAAAGYVTRVLYDRSAGTILVTWSDIRGMFSARLGHGVPSWTAGTLTVTNRSLSGAVRAIVTRAMYGDSTWQLPIDLPADGAGSFSRVWNYYAFMTMEDCLREVEDEGGEVWFDPYMAGSGIRFVTRVSAGYSAGTFDLPVTVSQSRVTELTVTRDGAKQVTGVIFAGNGTGKTQITAWAGFGASGDIVVRDAYQSNKDIKSPSQLQRIANAYLTRHNLPTEQWSFSVRLDDEVPIGVVLPGRRLRMDVTGDPWILDGTYPHNVIATSGGLGPEVKVEVQEYGG